MRSAICFVVDPSYFPFAVVQAVQATKFCRADVTIHIFVDGPDADTVGLDAKFSERFGERIIVHRNRLLQFVPDDWPATGVWPRVVFGRIFVHELIIVDRLLYLDVDTIINGPLDPLFELDMKGSPLAAADDVALFDIEGLYDRPFKRSPIFENYFNSGVLLIEVAQWRRRMTADNCRAALAYFGSEIAYPDQDLLNIMCPDRIRLSPRWNCQIFFVECALEPLIEPAIIHMTGFEKPWHEEMHELYPNYARRFRRAAEEAAVDLSSLSEHVITLRMNWRKAIRMKFYRWALSFGIGTGRAHRKLAEVLQRREVLTRWYRTGVENNWFADAPAVQEVELSDFVPCFNGRRYRLSIARHR